MLSKGVPIFP